ncbi:MAG: SRPBCC family protein [Thermomicrobiales bacterium]
MTMRADTQTVTISASPDEVFAFLAEPSNLPRWAVGFARAVRRDNDEWIVQTAQGEMPVRFAVDAGRGIIDFHMTVAPGVESVAYSRVVPNDSGAEYIFTQFQSPGMPDEVFAAQCAALAEELAILPILFRAHAVCPVGR